MTLNNPKRRVLAISSSTGGSAVIAKLLSGLPREKCGPVVIAHHSEPEFATQWAQWLNENTGWTVELVSERVELRDGVAYYPEGGKDLLVDATHAFGESAESPWVPSGNRLLTSAAKAWGANAIGLVLSGMGVDGGDGLAAIAAAGGTCFCQNPANSVMKNMPEQALQKASGAKPVAPDEMANVFVSLF